MYNYYQTWDIRNSYFVFTFYIKKNFLELVFC